MSIPLFWHVCDNFGDALSPWLVAKITGKPARFVSPLSSEEVPFLVTGSILGSELRRGIVWGAGAADERDLVDGFAPPSDSFRIVATRGPLSRELVARSGHNPVAHGDPGLLLPRFLPLDPEITMATAVFCSWINEHQVPASVPKYGSMTSSIESYVNAMLRVEVVLAGCLHALVAAVAYGKRVCWVRFPTPLMGTGFKFHDFFASIGVKDPEPIMIESDDDVARAVEQATVYEPMDTAPLLACCPFA